jgi:ABC-2 type transport system permease protein
MRQAFRSYWLLLVWQHQRFKRLMPMIVVIQLALALGIVYGLAFLIPNIDPRTAMYLATGAPTVTLLIMGLTIVPQEVSQGKLTGRFDYLSSLPIPRLATLASDVTYWLLAQLPGTVLALVVASIRFRFGLHISWAIVPAMLLVALSGACVGYAFAMILQPQIAQQVTSFISIGILLFSPINFPNERLPAVLRAVHGVLPVKYMGDLMRWSLTGRFVARPGLAFVVVAAWCAAGLAASYRVATKRS